MNEIAQAKRLISGKLGLHVIQFPTGTWGFVGSVPVDIYYVEGATQEEIDRAKFGERFGPKRRIFKTKEEAIQLAASRGYEVR